MGEEAHGEDLYSTLFTKAKTSTRHGLGLVVGGKASEKIDQEILALKQSQKENKDLRRMVENLKNEMKAKSEMMEMKCSEMVERTCNEMMVIFQASLRQNSTQEAAVTHPDLKATVEQYAVKPQEPSQSAVKTEEPTQYAVEPQEIESIVKQQEPRKSVVKKQEPRTATTGQENQTIQVEDAKKKGKRKNEEEKKFQSEDTVSKKQKMEKAEVSSHFS
jgi:hypothetical protein